MGSKRKGKEGGSSVFLLFCEQELDEPRCESSSWNWLSTEGAKPQKGKRKCKVEVLGLAELRAAFGFLNSGKPTNKAEGLQGIGS